MGVAEDVKAALVAANVVPAGTVADWACFVGMLPDSDPADRSGGPIVPDRAVCIYETEGQPAEEGFRMVYPTLQIRVRGAPDGYAEARAKLNAIFLALHAQEAAISMASSPPSVLFVYFYCMNSGPIPLGPDQRRRPHMAFNFRSARPI